MIYDKEKNVIERSVLCWLATSNQNHEPNVSPKEMFTFQDEHTLLIANIASPKSVQNILENPNVCVSLLDIFVQKGLKIKGRARIVRSSDADFEKKKEMITRVFSDQFPIKDVIEIEIRKVEKIIAPSYFLFPDTTEESQIVAAMKTYQVKPID